MRAPTAAEVVDVSNGKLEFLPDCFLKDQIIFKSEWRLQHPEFFQFNETESSNVAQADSKLNDLSQTPK